MRPSLPASRTPPSARALPARHYPATRKRRPRPRRAGRRSGDTALPRRRPPADRRHRRLRAVHAEPRRLRGDHRPAVHGARPRRGAGAARRRHHRLPRLADRVHPGLRLGRRPLRGEARLHGGDLRLRPRLGALRAGGQPARTGGGAKPTGPRRRHDGAGRSPPPAAAGAQGRDALRHGLAHHAGHAGPGQRPAARRLADGRFRLARGVPDQPADRSAGPRAGRLEDPAHASRAIPDHRTCPAWRWSAPRSRC